MISKFRIPPFLNSFSRQHFSKKKIYMKKSMASAVVWRLLLLG